MKQSNALRVRIKRVVLLFKELDFTLYDEQDLGDAYICEFENAKGMQGSIYIDEESRFFEAGFTFSFSEMMVEFIKKRLDDILRACYEYGCYININKNEKEFSFSVFTKLYFTGLNYYSLKHSLADYHGCVKEIMKIVELDVNKPYN
jgi:hypothetical protein